MIIHNLQEFSKMITPEAYGFCIVDNPIEAGVMDDNIFKTLIIQKLLQEYIIPVFEYSTITGVNSIGLSCLRKEPWTALEYLRLKVYLPNEEDLTIIRSIYGRALNIALKYPKDPRYYISLPIQYDILEDILDKLRVAVVELKSRGKF